MEQCATGSIKGGEPWLSSVSHQKAARYSTSIARLAGSQTYVMFLTKLEILKFLSSGAQYFVLPELTRGIELDTTLMAASMLASVNKLMPGGSIQ